MRVEISLFTKALFVLFMLFLPLPARAVTAEEVMKGSQAAFLYPGKDFKARVVMKLISQDGKERLREMAMLRKNMGEPGGDQRYFLYFFQPADVRGMSFMVYKYRGRESDRWLFVPALNMVRQIAAQDKRSSFVGSDFTYEDISGRSIEEDVHTLEKEEKIGDRECYVIKSAPRASDMEYSYRLSWIDKTILLPIKEEYYDRRGELYKVFTADEIQNVKGFPTAVKRTMRNVQSGHRTEVTFIKTDYNLGMEDSLFSERYLRQPPLKWIE